MKPAFPPLRALASALVLGAMAAASHAKVLDDFNDNVKTQWEDFSFLEGFGLPLESGGQFKFTLPAAGQSIFSASAKTSETFTIQEGRTIVFSVDLASTNGPDAFGVLGFIPTQNPLSQLAGYSLAKSSNDVLVVKGIEKYFYTDSPDEPLKNENITLVLSLTGKNGSVHINAKILDKDENNAVIFEYSAVDTPGTDTLAAGTDSPAAPYLGEGRFVLFGYQDNGRTQDTYEITFDNAETYVLDEVLVDDFNDNTKTEWADFTFVPGFGLPAEANGKFTFSQPAAGSSIFSASVKTSPVFELKEGERLKFRVDVDSTNGQDAFAVLGFIPTGSAPGELAGYSLAKSETDVLVTKGINKYFYNEHPEEPVKNENIALVLTLTMKDGSVIINGQVLDRDDNDAIIFEYTAVDTVGADPLVNGTDSPAAPFSGTGNFVLYCYQDDGKTQDTYEVIYDNAVAWRAPLAGNATPIISDISPQPYQNFLPATAQISFKARDDQPLPDSAFSITLNGQAFTTANGLSLSAAGPERTATLGGLQPNVNYIAQLKVADAEGAERVETVWLDTFEANSFVIEIEDYNFDAGDFVDSPVLVAEGGGPVEGTYNGQYGELNIDYFDTRTTLADVPYRYADYVRMQRSLDFQRAKFLAAGGAEQEIYDYAVGDFQPGEWMNYTRTFPAGTYQVYLRQSQVNFASYAAVLEEVTSNPREPDQTTSALGTFRGTLTGFQFGNIPLTNTAGTALQPLSLSGVKTLRLRQTGTVPGDGSVAQNYLIFIRQPDAVGAPFHITSVSYDSAAKSVTFSWPSETGAAYKIETSPTLAAGSWTTLAPAHPSQGVMTSYTDTPPETSGARYYRVTR